MGRWTMWLAHQATSVCRIMQIVMRSTEILMWSEFGHVTDLHTCPTAKFVRTGPNEDSDKSRFWTDVTQSFKTATRAWKSQSQISQSLYHWWISNLHRLLSKKRGVKHSKKNMLSWPNQCENNQTVSITTNLISDVVYDDNAVCAPVIRGSNSSEPFLSCCVPNLKLYRLTVLFYRPYFLLNRFRVSLREISDAHNSRQYFHDNNDTNDSMRLV